MSRKLPADAFELYVSLGEGRSHQAVADHYGCSRRAVSKCASRERWAERLAAIEQKSRERSDERIAETLDEIRERHLKTVRAIAARALRGLKELPLATGMEAVRAAEIAVKLERLIQGEANERSEVTVEEMARREMDRWLEPEA